MWMSKAQEHFADTLAEFQYELSGKDLYKAFYKAAYENAEAARKEYEKTKELMDMLRYSNLGQD
jgi:23S rRNA G2445 N2-methylase RlmL